ncbi:MAG: PRC-barrel domain-containing protein [archaeon]|nr:PRC-barrel domain-containing protein [archaeon]
MKIKQLLGMVAVDNNANDIGKIIDVDFDPSSGKIEKLTISLKKSFLSNEKVEVSFDDVKSIGDYVLLDTEIETKLDVEDIDESEPVIQTVEAEIVEDDEE